MEPSLDVQDRVVTDIIRASGLFDAAWYCASYPGVAAENPLGHYLGPGRARLWRPNPYFDPGWYLDQHPELRAQGVEPLLHYALQGERDGSPPIAWFDPTWYAATHGLLPGTALRHFLQHRRSGKVAPVAEFDPAFYLARYPDVAAAGVDPFEHYLLQGFREGRDPSAAFDTRFYRARYLHDAPEQNPLLHWRAHRGSPGLFARRPAHETGIAELVRAHAAPGPLFERVAGTRPPPGRVRVLAFYLPQFHPVPENDAWWGEGFTEWTNVARGLPRFAGHYQPRTPRDLGHYDLRLPGVIARQIALARGAGIGGFVFYYYRFGPRRLLEAPLEAFLADPALDFPFCVMWANENWTRNWDGAADRLLIEQPYDAAQEAALLADFARYFADPRHIRLAGRPLLMLYRAACIPDTAATIARWRRILAARHGANPLIVMAQCFGAADPRPLGLDGAVEFPPHRLVDGLPTLNAGLDVFDPDFSAQVHGYEDVVAASLATPATEFPRLRTACPGWDNDARRQGAGLVLQGATPARYQAWLEGLIARAEAEPSLGEPVVCVNAWNEWAEGAYLEPDQHFGAAFLNATGRAIAAAARQGASQLLLVGHDAFPAGAQLLLLALGRHLRAAHGLEIGFLLLGGGALAPQYEAVAPLATATPATLDATLAALHARGFRAALVNSLAAAPACPALARHGFRQTLLAHELPPTLRRLGLEAAIRVAAGLAAHVVVAAACVGAAVQALAPDAPIRLLPQGIYQEVSFDAAARSAWRRRLGVAPRGLLVIGIGHGDWRKGFDLFLQLWRSLGPQAHALWLGALAPELRGALGPEIAAAEATGRLHLPGWREDVADLLSAADVLALTSREDPFPSAVLEALACGVPAVAFADAGGAAELLAGIDPAWVVPLGDVAALAAAARQAAGRRMRARLAALARRAFDFPTYAARLRDLALPGLPRISVVVPSHNYARFLDRRLASIFAQGQPVEEVILLDDASTDDSLAVAEGCALSWRRALRVVAEPRNSGSVFRQWHRAARLARGDWLWIAEADDDAAPDFLASLVRALQAAPQAVLAFTDSAAIDADGACLWPSYRDYYRAAGVQVLDADGVFPAAEFLRLCLAERNLIVNVSAVLWRRTALLAALDRCAGELAGFSMAGDWRLYAELLAASPGQVAYVARPLNLHRRHGESVTARLAPAKHVAEIGAVQRRIAALIGNEAGLARRQARYRQGVARKLGPKPGKRRPPRRARPIKA